MNRHPVRAPAGSAPSRNTPHAAGHVADNSDRALQEGSVGIDFLNTKPQPSVDRAA